MRPGSEDHFTRFVDLATDAFVIVGATVEVVGTGTAVEQVFAGPTGVGLAACGGSDLSMSEYGDQLREITATYGPQAEAAWVEFMELPEPTLEDLKTLFDRDVAARLGVMEAWLGLDPPSEIANLHVLLSEWLTSLTEADEALLVRIAAVDSWDEFLHSAEYQAFEEALLGGAEVCAEFQSKLDASAARGVFADNPWIPGDLKEVADAVIGCEAIPDDLDPAFWRVTNGGTEPGEV